MSAPFYVNEGEPHRPTVTIWLELPDDLVVGTSLATPGEEPPLPETLRAAIDHPLAGPPRRPDRIRIADAVQAAEIRAALPDLEVRVGPTPELTEVVRSLADFLAREDDQTPDSYLDQGRIDPEAMARLFRAAAALYQVAPWEILDDDKVLRLDVPALNIRGACVSVIGALGESRGVIIFPSWDGYWRFVETVENHSAGQLDDQRADNLPLDLGTSMLALDFGSGDELSEEMRAEIARYGWALAASDAFPFLQHHDRDGTPRPLSNQDLQLASACATSLCALVTKHRSRLAREAGPTICESYLGRDGLELRLTYPFRTSHLFAVDDSPPAPSNRSRAGRKTGRNQPCPCGSGKKYKQCCLRRDDAAADEERRARTRETDGPAAAREIDGRLVVAMDRFAMHRFGDDFLHRAAKDFDDFQACVQLGGPWALYCLAVQGKTIAEWYLDERAGLPAEERAWLEAQKRAWLSAWEVVGVEPGHSLTLRDLLSGEERTVQEVSGSRDQTVRNVLLARLVDFEGVTVLAGCHPRPLPPREAAEVVGRLRGRLRRKTAVPVDRLRDEKFGRYAIKRWDEAVAELEQRAAMIPRLKNTDGEELLLTVDHFDIAAGAAGEVERRLAKLPGVEPPEPGQAEREFVFVREGNALHRAWDNTITGQAVVGSGRLRLETNSIARADHLRSQVEQACGELIVHRLREHSDPTTRMATGDRGSRAPAPAVPAPEGADEIIRAFKARHYADWPDQPLPALGNRTPREAVRTRAGKREVDLLLKDCEHLEAKLPAAQRFDFSAIRRELGL